MGYRFEKGFSGLAANVSTSPRRGIEQMTNGQGRVVVITGGTRGLGAALAEGFAREGASLALCGTDAAALAAVERRILALGVACVAELVDVTDVAATERWGGRVLDELGPPSVLINNASLLGCRVPLLEQSLEEWRRVIDVNLTGTFIGIRAFLPAMLRAGEGTVINVSSGAAIPPRVDWGAYAVSKSALESFSMNLAEELNGTGVRVYVVDPGGMRTDMRASAYPEEDPCTLKEPIATLPLFLWLTRDPDGISTGARIQADKWLAVRQ
jgi:NAD(P)-dependent dehydrogenase (short-subunit alcohol dehydrogenase family)